MWKKISEDSIKDVFNADEFELFYKLASDSSIGSSMFAGKKKKKERLSILAIENKDGTEKLTMAISGKSKKPKCFGEKTRNEISFNYHFNSNSWMNL